MNYLFEDKADHVKLKDLNYGYGDLGRTFETKKGAEVHKRSLKNAYITRLVEYKYCDLMRTENIGTHKKDAVPYAIAWLVTDMDKTRYVG